MQLVGATTLCLGSLAHVLNRETGDERPNLVGHPEALRLDEHAGEPWLDRQPRKGSADACDAALLDRTELGEERQTVRDTTLIGRGEKRKLRDVAKPETHHLQHDRGEARAQNLRVGVLGPREIVFFAIEAHDDAWLRAPGTTCSLASTRLRDRLDGQVLHLAAGVIARDASGAAVDDVDDARHRETRLGDVRRENDAPCRARLRENPVLLCRAQPAVERKNLKRLSKPGVEPLQGVLRVANLRLSGEEHENVAGALAGDLDDALLDRVDEFERLGALGCLLAFAAGVVASGVVAAGVVAAGRRGTLFGFLVSLWGGVRV